MAKKWDAETEKIESLQRIIHNQKIVIDRIRELIATYKEGQSQCTKNSPLYLHFDFVIDDLIEAIGGE